MADIVGLWVDLRRGSERRPRPAPFDSSNGGLRFHRTGQIGGLHSVIRQQRPRLLIFDYDFPDALGLKALQQSKTDYPSIPVLMLTEHHSESLAVWAFRSGVRDYLVKPLTNELLRGKCIQLAAIGLSSSPRPCRRNHLPQPQLPQDVRVESTPRTARAMVTALSYMETHFHEKLSLDKVSSLCGLTRFEFSRAFKRAFGTTFRDQLIDLRIRKAAELLEYSNAKILDIAFAVGFRDLSHFTRTFHRWVGATPSQYRSRPTAIHRV